MAIATLEPDRTDRRHLAVAVAGTPRDLRAPAAAGATGEVPPARRPAPPAHAGIRAATRSDVPAQVRRRAALALLVIAVAATITLVQAGDPAGAAAPIDPTAPAVAAPAGPVLVVGPGETVWNLVGPHTPAGRDRAVYVTEVLAHNGLDATAIPPGTVVRLP